MTTEWMSVGLRVEVLLTDEGLFGSRYAGRVLEIQKAKALVEFEARTGAQEFPLDQCSAVRPG